MRKLFLFLFLSFLAYTAGATCTAGFNWASAPTAANPLRVLFTSTATWTGTAPSTYAYTQYRFGDGSSTYGFGMYHNYATPGTYTVVQILTTIDSVSQAVLCMDSAVQQVTIAYQPCAGNYTYTITGNSTVNFTAQNYANTPGATYTWTFGDGTSGSGSPVSHTYAANGTYTARLYISAGGCVDTVAQNIVISNNPGGCAGHTASFTTLVSGSTVYFYNTVASFAGQTTALSWSFGDGTSGSGSNPVHTYASSGVHTVKLIVAWTDSVNGNVACRDTVLGYVITSQTNNCSGHYASFTDYVNNTTVYFYNSSPSFAGQTPHYMWSFGDGTVSTTANPIHTYPSASTYYVNLLVYWTDSSNNVICSDSITHTVNTTTAPNIIRGLVIVDSSSNMTTDTFKVWLIVHDSTNGTLTAIDSTIVSGIWTAQYSFSNKPAGTYLVKAAMLGQMVGSSGYVPTYYDSSLYWNQAINFFHSGGTSGYFDIYMRHGIVTSGPGFVGGNISMGANKGTSGGIEGILVYLEDQNGKLIASTYTDFNGDYSFSNLPLGTYTLYPEDMNYITTPITGIQLTAGNTSSTDNNFGQNSTEIKPKSTGIITLPSGSYLTYPNPAATKVYIRWAQAPVQAQITITDVAGHKVYEASVKNTATVTDINVAQLQSGMYFLHIKTEAGEHTDKLVIQH
ncbi:PKD domain-containing protein [Chitinophagaceae bacterium MMS25-I14]